MNIPTAGEYFAEKFPKKTYPAKKIECNCDNCGKEIIVNKNKYDRHKHHFCQMTCYSEFRTKRGRKVTPVERKEIQSQYFEKKWTQQKIADKHNLSQPHVSRIISNLTLTGKYKNYKRLSKDEMPGFLFSIKQGVKAAAIALEYKCSIGAVYYWRNKINTSKCK